MQTSDLDELVAELRRMNPDAPVLRYFTPGWKLELERARRLRQARDVESRKLEAAFSRLRRNVAALLLR